MRRAKFDRPEVWLAVHGYLVAFMWEMLQMPFYEIDYLSPWEATVNCNVASLGDAGIMVFAYAIASGVSKDRYWLHENKKAALSVFLGTGLIMTLAIEYLATTASWGWRYSALMPTLFGRGLVPVVMWIVVPLVALGLASRSTRRSADQC